MTLTFVMELGLMFGALTFESGPILGQAKNGDKVFWEEKFHAADGKAQTCTQGALPFPF